MKKTTLLIPICLTLCLLTPLAVLAFEVKTGNSVFVPSEQVIEGNLYAGASTLTIDGTINGDVICAAQSVTVNGKVAGDVICGAQTVIINGEIGGSVRAVGNTINLNGPIARNVQALGASISLGTGATVGWDMFLAGAIGEIRGKIGGDLHGGVASIIIAGEVNKNVRLRLDNNAKNPPKEMIFANGDKPVTITETAVIGGDVIYSAREDAAIAEGASITGEITRNEPKAADKRDFTIFKTWGKLISFFAALVVGLVLISLWRQPTKDLTERMLKRITPAIGWGAVIMFIGPIIVILLLITLIGIPLALIMFALWLIALYLSKILVGIVIGRSLIEKLWPKKKNSLIWAMLIGVAIVSLICWLPFIGWILCLIALWWGLGGIWLHFKKA